MVRKGRVGELEGIIDIRTTTLTNECLQHFIGVAEVFYLVLDSECEVLEFNPYLCKALGVDAVEIQGSRWVDRFVAPEFRAAAKAKITALLAKDGNRFAEDEYEVLLRGDGQRRIRWQLTSVCDQDDTPNSVVAFGIDVTADQAGFERARRYASFPLQNPNPVLSMRPDGDVLLANKPAQHLLEKIANSTADATATWKKFVAAAIELAHQDNLELRIVDQIYLFSVVNLPKQSQVMFYGLNVTEHHDLNHKFRSIVQSLPGAMWNYRLFPDGHDHIEYMNRGCAEIWEVESEELSSDPTLLWSMTLPEDLPDLRASVEASAQSMKLWRHEWRIKTPSNKIKWLSASGSPERLSDGSTRWTTIVFDITETRQAQAEAAEALRDTVFALAAALESRDPYTAGHQQRVTEIAAAIGRELQLDPQRLEGLQLAGIVHDLGKIQIPAEILSKPTRLTPQEFDLIKTHPDVGADLLKNLNSKWPISEIVRQHHERIDGTGYPKGLKGDQILFEARIIAVADVLEAMASHRPYRPGLGIERALEEIRAGYGTRYDAAVVDACLRAIDNGAVTL